MAETLAEFDEDALQEIQSKPKASVGTKKVALENLESTTSWTVHLTFLSCVFIGAIGVASLIGQFELRCELSPVHTGCGYTETPMGDIFSWDTGTCGV